MAVSRQRGKGTGSIYRNARGQWVAAVEAGWTERGTRRRITLKAPTKAEVRTRLADLKQVLAAESTSVHPLSSISVKCWSDQWLEQRQRVMRPGTFVSDRSSVSRWIVPTIGQVRLDALAPSDIRRISVAQEDAGLTLPTMQRTHAVLGKLLTDAVAEGFRVPQRARETAGPGPGVSSRQPLTIGDATKILKVALNRSDASRWVLALVAGVRPAEALGLTWDMVDLDSKTITLAWQIKALPYVEKRTPASGFRVPRGFESRQIHNAYHLVRPKTRSGNRVVPLVPWLADSLMSWKTKAPYSPAGLVWPRDDGTPRSAEFDRAQWYEIVDAAGVTISLLDGSRRRPLLYEARHTAATLLLAEGVDETTIKSVLGHSTVISTQAYLHTDLTRTRSALETSASNVGLDRYS